MKGVHESVTLNGNTFRSLFESEQDLAFSDLNLRLDLAFKLCKNNQLHLLKQVPVNWAELGAHCLQIALSSNYYEVADYCLDQADLRVYSDAPIIECFQSRRFAMALKMLRKLERDEPVEGMNLMHHLFVWFDASAEASACFEQLMQLRVDPNKLTNFGDTPLDLAISHHTQAL